MTLVESPRPAASARRLTALPVRASVLDPVLVGLVSLAVYALHGFEGPLNRDLGLFVYGGEQVARGVPPYVGVFNTVGPLADAVPGLAIRLGGLMGLDPVLSARLFFLVLSALCCALVSVLARDTFGSRTVALLAPAVFLTFECFIELASSGPREKTTMLVFLLVSLILVGRRRWFGAGACAALATLTWQPALVVAVAAVVVAALTAGPGRARALVRFVTGGALPTVVTALYFLQVGAARRALDGFFVVNLRYTTQPSIFNGSVLRQLWHDYHASLLLVVVGLVTLLVLAGRAAPYVVLPAEGPSTVAWRLTAVGAAGLAGTVWTICVVNGGPDLFVVLPFAALGAAGGLVLLAATLPLRAAVPAVALLAVAGVAVASLEAVTSRKDTLVLQRADALAVLGTQPADATIVSIDAPQVLAVSHRTSLWSYQLFDERMDDFIDATRPGGTAGLAALLARERPTFVVVGALTDSTWEARTLADHYRRVGRGPGWIWYVSNDVGPAALADAHAANLAAMGR
jgi:hypothetical protein